MVLNILNKETCDIINASYAVPDLETAVKQGHAVIYNSIDAHAKAIKLVMNVAMASFTAFDDGDGIQPDELCAYIGECYASSRASLSTSARNEKKPHKSYGCRGAFLRDLTALSEEVEVESRVEKHWTSYRKHFKGGIVVFNARSQHLREGPGTTVAVSNLFWKLPVRHKDLLRNKKHRSRVIKNIFSFCVSMSMIWPSLSFDIRYIGDDVRPVAIPAVRSCRERLMRHFGQLLGKELQYVDFTSKVFSFSIRGYIAFIPEESEALGQGIKQAKSYYQFAYFENMLVEECHRQCSRVITEAALQLFSAIPIFILKVAALSNNYDISRVGKNSDILFKSPEQFHQVLYEFVGTFAATDFNHDSTLAYKSNIIAPKCNEKDRAAVEWVEEEAAPGCIYPSEASKATLQEWSNEVILTPPSPQKMYLSVDKMDGGYDYEDDRWTSAIEERVPWADQCYTEDYSVEAATRCHVCGQCSNVGGNSVVTPRKENHVPIVAPGSLGFKAAGSEASYYALHCEALEDIELSESEHSLDNIFFFHKPYSSLMKPQTPADTKSTEKPWLSSEPDAFDCADDLLDLCPNNCSDKIICDSQDNDRIGDGEQETWMLVADDKQLSHKPDTRPPLKPSVLPGSRKKSNYFNIKRLANSFVKHWINSKLVLAKPFAEALRIENVVVCKGDQSIKISKSTLEKLQVISQVDRKFILVHADTQRGKLVLCIDQHAADERVRLETLEKEMFNQDGSLCQVETDDHEPPLAVRMNFKEREALSFHKDLIRSWGFDFEVVASEPRPFFDVRRKPETEEIVCVLLYTTPKVEKRVANADDFREFIQLLSSASDVYLHSRIRPPVITRLLHSRACRSAIMFGDYLSLGQCKDLIEDLKTCQLPFQCAHGRPSVVPLVEVHNDIQTRD